MPTSKTSSNAVQMITSLAHGQDSTKIEISRHADVAFLAAYLATLKQIIFDWWIRPPANPDHRPTISVISFILVIPHASAPAGLRRHASKHCFQILAIWLVFGCVEMLEPIPKKCHCLDFIEPFFGNRTKQSFLIKSYCKIEICVLRHLFRMTISISNLPALGIR